MCLARNFLLLHRAAILSAFVFLEDCKYDFNVNISQKDSVFIMLRNQVFFFCDSLHDVTLASEYDNTSDIVAED